MSDPISQVLTGPHDVSEVGSTLGFISFGSILMPTIEGVSVRVEVDENTGDVVAVSFEHDGSVLQVSAFAASKSDQLWEEIYLQLIETITTTGGEVSETRDLRFIGFNGPRWFLRGAITGVALTDPAAALNMEDIFRSLVIDRGNSPLPPREPLPLRVPDGTFVPPKSGL